MADSDLSWHPLFAPKDEEIDPDDTPPDIQEIVVQRKENGRLFTAPRTFLPGELKSLSDLFTEFGGGEYHLIGRDHLKRMRSRSVHNIPGASKQMYDEAAQQVAAPKPVTPPMNPMMAMMGGAGEGGMMGLIMMMMQSMMAQQAQASQQSMQMMMAFIQSISQGTSADKAAAQEAMNRQAERDSQAAERQMQMFVKLTEAKQAGNSTGGEDSFFKGVEFMRHFSTQQFESLKAASASGKGGGDFDLESLLESGMQALQTFTAFQDMKNNGLPTAATEVVP